MVAGPKVTVHLQKPTQTTTSGVTSYTWEDVCSFDAVLTQMSGYERSIRAKQMVEASHRLIFDYMVLMAGNVGEVKEKNRIRYSTRYFDIVLANNVGQANRYFVLDLREVKEEEVM